MSSSGFDLILSTICINATLCALTPTPDAPFTLPNTTGTPQAYITKWEQLHAKVEFFKGKHIKIGTVQNYPLSYTTKNENGTLIGGGVAFEIVDLLQEKFKFTYEVVLPSENLEGDSTDMKNSLLGLLVNQEIDLAAAFLPKLSKNMEMIRYSPSLDEGVWVILMKRPKESANGSGLLAPFTAAVWFLILIAVTTFGPIIYLIGWLRYIFTRDENNKPYKMTPCVWFVYGALIKQGSTLSPDANTTRVLFATWWIFITLLSAFYTANLTAFLTLSKFTLSINDPQDLYKKNNRWTARKGSAVEYVVASPNEDIYFLNTMVVKNRAVFQSNESDSDFLPYVQQGFVFVRDKPAVEHLMYDDYKNKTKQDVEEKFRCTYVITKNSFMKKNRGFAYPLNSTLQPLFDPILSALTESGIIKYKMKYGLPGNEICPQDLKSNERKLRNSDLSMTYMIAGFGFVMATVAFIIEVIHIHWNKLCNLHCTSFGRKESANSIIKVQEKPSPGPPPYKTIFKDLPYRDVEQTMKNINGRDYWIMKTRNGDSQLVPMRSPSAYLFQYTN